MQAARAVLPFWVVWGPALFLPPAAFLLSLTGAWAAAALALRRFRRAGAQPWFERARLAHPARIAARANARILPALLGGLAFALDGPLCPVPRGVVALLTGLAAWAGAALVAWRVERGVQPGRWGSREWLQGTAAAALVLYLWLGVLVLVLVFLPSLPGPWLWAALALAGLALAFFVAGGGLLLARLVGLARPPSDRLRSVVDRAAARVGVRPRATYELCLPQANALAFPLGGQVAFTPAILAVLDDDELTAVCAHELGHLAEPRLVALTRALPVFLLLLPAAGLVLLPAVGLVPLAAMLLAVLVVLVICQRLAHRLEGRADRLARAHEEGEGVYARALAKLYEANLSPAVHPGRGTTHPHLYDRLTAAGAPPDYPRPKAPSRALPGVALALLPMLLAGVLLFGYFRVGSSAAARSEPALLCSLALWGGAHDLGELGRVRYLRGDRADAAALYQAATEAERRSPYYPANWAIALAALGRCDEAELAAGEAARRCAARGGEGVQFVREAIGAVLYCRRVGPGTAGRQGRRAPERAGP
jgi:Zn-dependent protease with chaperone function